MTASAVAPASHRVEPPPAALRLARIEHLAFGPGRPYVPDPLVRRYFEDMLGCHGLAYEEDRYAAGNRNSFVDMGAALVRAMAPLGGDLDLIVIAHAVFDCDPRRSTASHLARICPGDPLAFAISDQGVVAPFTALQIVHAYAVQETCERALVVIIDQSTTPYDEPAIKGMRTDHAVGLLLATEGSGRFGAARQYLDVPPDQVRGLVATEVGTGGNATTVILGAALDPARHLPDLDWSVLRAPDGRLCTGLWTELAGGLARWAVSGQRVVAIDYDPALGQLCLLNLDVGP